MKNHFKILAASTFLALSVFAHEGHDKTPGAMAAPHGGLVQGTTSLYLELVSVKNEVKIYPLDHDSKPLPVSDVKLESMMTLPRKTKAEKVSFMPQEDHFAATIDAKGAHRYELNIDVTYKGKKEKVKFNVEP